MPLSPPTRRTFASAVLLIAIGIVSWLQPLLSVPSEVAFWAVSAGAVLLMIGTMFNKLRTSTCRADSR